MVSPPKYYRHNDSCEHKRCLFGNTSPPIPIGSAPLYDTTTVALYQWWRKRGSPLPYSTHKKTTRATDTSEREGSSSRKKIRLLTPLWGDEIRLHFVRHWGYTQREMQLLFRNVPTLAEPYPEKQIFIKYVREYPQRENGYIISALYTMDNIYSSTYKIPNSIIGIV